MSEGKELIAYCGLYCGDCYRAKGKIADLARDLRKELRLNKFDVVAEAMADISFFAAFKGYRQCYELLGEMVKLRCNRNCRNGGGPPVCKIKECCKKKEYEGCWECADFRLCKKLDSLNAFHKEAHIKNLALLKKSGTDSFIKGKRNW